VQQMGDLPFFPVNYTVSLVEEVWAEGSPREECSCMVIIEFRRNSDKQPRGWFWSRIRRRVSILLLIGSQQAAPLLLQSSNVLDCRGWPARMMVSTFIRLGKSHWPAPVR